MKHFKHSPTNGISTGKYTNGSNGGHVTLARMTNVKTHWNNTVMDDWGLQSDWDLWIQSDKNKLKCHITFNHDVHKGLDWSSSAPLAWRKAATDKKHNWLIRSLHVPQFTHQTDSEFLSCFHAVSVPFRWHYLVLIFPCQISRSLTHEVCKKIGLAGAVHGWTHRDTTTTTKNLFAWWRRVFCFYCVPLRSGVTEMNEGASCFLFCFFYYTVLLSDRNTAKVCVGGGIRVLGWYSKSASVR